MGLNATENTSVPPVGNGEPAACVSTPCFATENTVTVSPLASDPSKLAAARSPPHGLNATEVAGTPGPPPVANGEPMTGVSTPLWSTANIATAPLPLPSPLPFAIASSRPLGLKATENALPVANGNPCTGVSAPSWPIRERRNRIAPNREQTPVGAEGHRLQLAGPDGER